VFSFTRFYFPLGRYVQYKDIGGSRTVQWNRALEKKMKFHDCRDIDDMVNGGRRVDQLQLQSRIMLAFDPAAGDDACTGAELDAVRAAVVSQFEATRPQAGKPSANVVDRLLRLVLALQDATVTWQVFMQEFRQAMFEYELLRCRDEDGLDLISYAHFPSSGYANASDPTHVEKTLTQVRHCHHRYLGSVSLVFHIKGFICARSMPIVLI
jgi:hypothetical protein